MTAYGAMPIHFVSSRIDSLLRFDLGTAGVFNGPHLCDRTAGVKLILKGATAPVRVGTH